MKRAIISSKSVIWEEERFENDEYQGIEEHRFSSIADVERFLTSRGIETQKFVKEFLYIPSIATILEDDLTGVSCYNSWQKGDVGIASRGLEHNYDYKQDLGTILDDLLF